MLKKISHRILPIWLVLSLAFVPPASSADKKKVREELMVGKLIYHSSLFVHFPDSKNAFHTVNICMMGVTKAYAAVTQEIFDKVNSKEVDGAATKEKRTYKMLLPQEWANPGNDCHILYIGNEAESEVRSGLKEVQNQPVLTISKIKGFATYGGMVEIDLEGSDSGKKIGAINLSAAEQAGIRIDADLLENAARVIGK